MVLTILYPHWYFLFTSHGCVQQYTRSAEIESSREENWRADEYAEALIKGVE